ncbi:MAG: dihydropteroate synthase [Chthoniobacteraceae bacterium]
MKLRARGHELTFPRTPIVMGILNLSVDSFSGDGFATVDAALDRGREMIAEGAEIIDVGAESARTNRDPISEEDEAALLRKFIGGWRGDALLSINTWRPAVARAALEMGGHILNDIGGLPGPENAALCAETGAALLIMHSVGAPKVPHTHVGYDNIMVRLEEFFAEKIALAESTGLPRESIVIDPGIDFAKQRDDNLRIFRELDRLKKFERPILLPVSRKTVIGEVLGIENAADRDAGTVACVVQGMARGASIFRVHNVRAAVQTVRMISSVISAP